MTVNRRQQSNAPAWAQRRSYPLHDDALGLGALLPPARTMKARRIQEQAEFTPVKIEITFETRAQLDTFGTLMNCVPLCEAYSQLSGDESELESVREACKEAGADVHKTSEVVKVLKKHRAITD